ncbi:MAG: MFS transporter [Chloroflexi bacterium]|nr:MFS transporter [Chloroflexota bacterium]
MQDYSRIARKITFILFIAQSLASAGFIASATISSIIGAKLGGGSAWAGVPSAVYLLGGAFAASAWGYLMDIFGRRKGIALGLATGAVGTVIVIISIDNSIFFGFLVGMLLMGIANAAVVLGRFAAAEVNPPERRGAAISAVVLGGTFGSVFGPLIVGPSGSLVKTLGMDELAGAYLVCFGLFALASLIVFFTLTPDPRDVGREISKLYPELNPTGEARSIWTILRQPKAFTALMAMVLGQVVMVAVMVITSLHMKDNHHMLTDISTVISAHTFGMYAFSIISGWLVDKWGRAQVILTGAIVLILACISAPFSPDVLPLAISLFLLGLGWNFCFVGGSTLLADQLSPAERARTQGTNDLLVGLASATASLSSGIIFATLGYALVAALGAALAVIPVFFSIRMLWQGSRKSSLQA